MARRAATPQTECDGSRALRGQLRIIHLVSARVEATGTAQMMPAHPTAAFVLGKADLTLGVGSHVLLVILVVGLTVAAHHGFFGAALAMPR